MSNAGVIQTFGVNDLATADMLSRTIGHTTIEYETFGPVSIFRDGIRSESFSSYVAARRLATPDEIMRMNPDDLLLLRQGQHPLVVGKIRYYAEREFVGLYDPASSYTPAKPTTGFGVSPLPALSTSVTPTDTHRRIGSASVGSLRPSGRSCEGDSRHETKAYCPKGNSASLFLPFELLRRVK